MKKMNRSFRFFSEYMLMMLGITVASAVLFVLFRGVPLSQKMNVRGFVVCLMVIGGFVEILMEMNGYQLYLSMMLSFGCTRKEFFRGMQLSRLGYIVILLLGGSVCIHLFSAEGWTAAEVLFFLWGLILCGSIGNIFSALYLKFGKVHPVLMMVIFGGLGAGMGIVAGAGRMPQVMAWMMEKVPTAVPVAAVLTGIACLLGYLGIRRAVSHYECGSYSGEGGAKWMRL